jgi:hypothetical protein
MVFQLVFLQVSGILVGLVAQITGIVSMLRVDQAMAVQQLGCVKPLVAHFTHMVPLPVYVDLHVKLELVHVSKRLVANETFMVSLSSVQLFVPVQAANGVELLAANIASMLSLSGVDPLVSVQKPNVIKRFAADFAYMFWFAVLCGVNHPLVFLEVTESVIGLVADVADKVSGSLLRMDLFVSLQVSVAEKSLAADVTHTLPFFSGHHPLHVNPALVLQHVSRQPKGLLAHITHMIFLPCVDQLVFLQVGRTEHCLTTHITHMV